MNVTATRPVGVRTKRILVAFTSATNARREVLTLECGHTISRAKASSKRRRTVCPVCPE